MKYRIQVFEGDEQIFEGLSESYAPLKVAASAFIQAYKADRQSVTVKRHVWEGWPNGWRRVEGENEEQEIKQGTLPG